MNKDIVTFEPSTALVRFLATSGISKYKKSRSEKILKALDQGLISQDSHQVQSDDFIAAYLATEHALMMSSSKSKFNFLLNLFIQGSSSGRIEKEPDAYQEVLSIVDELSERELILLYHLYNYEREHGIMRGQLSRDHHHQIKYLCGYTGLEKELVVSLIVRLRRTGLIITYGEKSEHHDLMMSGIEIMFISPIANEIQEWVFGVIENSFQIQ